MKEKKSTHVFVLEEHHEAYFVWRYALRKGLIRKQGNNLLHIDEHSDMGSPTLNVSLHSLNGDLNKVRDFTYKELNIASFIVPAVYDKIIRDVYWIKQRHDKVRQRGNVLYVRSAENEGKQLITGKLSVLENFEKEKKELQESIVPFQFYKRHVDGISKVSDVLLDIDLDYFSCIQDPLRNELRIEITYDEYLKYKQTLYHRIKFFDFGRTEVIQRKGKYYYCLNNYQHVYISPLKVSKEEIISRIETLCQMLQHRQIKPQIITICRSRFSGYTPKDQWEFIETKLLERLGGTYNLQAVTHISDLK
ncbi:MAG: UPF0489 family protein [Cyclobacteriaceae bacterium]|nr:UPF0489 family protein [Cyclobacteriaceae bacterium]